MQYVNASLTSWTQPLQDRAGRLITQAQAVKARAVRFAHHFAADAQRTARAALARFLKLMLDTHQAMLDLAVADKMAVRRMFYENPYAKSGKFTKDGARTLARWIKHAKTFSHDYSAEVNDEMKGMQKMLDFILADLLNDPVEFLQAMKAEEDRRSEELVPT